MGREGDGGNETGRKERKRFILWGKKPQNAAILTKF